VRKIEEYKDRANLSDGNPPKTSILGVVSREEEIVRKAETVAQLENQVKGCQMLPPDIDAAKEVVTTRRAELAELSKKREALFERLMK
jgi:hypothetical protein